MKGYDCRKLKFLKRLRHLCTSRYMDVCDSLWVCGRAPDSFTGQILE